MVAQAETLPTPDDFRFQWDSPEEAAHFWMLDMMHWPHGLSPLSATMDMPAFMRGFTKAARELCMPFTSMHSKVIHGWVYMNAEPYSADPVQLERRMADMQAQMGKHVPGLLERWRDVYEPEVRSINDETLKGDYSKLGDRDLADHLQAIVDKRERAGELHMLAVFPAMGAVMFYEQVYNQLFGEPKGSEHLQLLQGFPNKSIEVGVGLWNLAREAQSVLKYSQHCVACRHPMRIPLSINASADLHSAGPSANSSQITAGALTSRISRYQPGSNSLRLPTRLSENTPADTITTPRPSSARSSPPARRASRCSSSSSQVAPSRCFNRFSPAPSSTCQFRRTTTSGSTRLASQCSACLPSRPAAG